VKKYFSRLNKFVHKYRYPLFWSLVAIFFLVWLWLRLAHLSESWLFFNDTGRDYWEVWKFWDQGKIPLLGPQNSATPLSQTPFYFYLLTPLLGLSGFSFWATQVTLLIFTWIIIGLCLAIIYRRPKEWPQFFILLSLFCFSPLVITQSRSVWIPSFVWPLLLLAFYLLTNHQLWSKKFPKRGERLVWISIGTLLALASAFSFSIAPAILVFGILGLIINRRKQLWYWLGVVGGSILFFLPTIAFELRYDFQITKRFLASLSDLFIQKGGRTPTALTWSNKWTDFYNGIFKNEFLAVLTLLFIAGWLIYSIYRFIKTQKPTKLSPAKILPHLRQPFALAVLGFLLVSLFTLAAPFPLYSHYLFGFLFFIFMMLATLPHWSKYLLTIILIYFWLQLISLGNYFRPTQISFATLNQCVAQICSELQDKTTFTSITSTHHPWHAGPEFKFSLSFHGCQVKEIDSDPEAAGQMLIFGHDEKFVLGQSSYHELTLFGPAQLIDQGKCNSSLSWYLIAKSDPN